MKVVILGLKRNDSVNGREIVVAVSNNDTTRMKIEDILVAARYDSIHPGVCIAFVRSSYIDRPGDTSTEIGLDFSGEIHAMRTVFM